ncbi:MAG: arsenate reductase (glutaredoxin) [Parvularcula sp.]
MITIYHNPDCGTSRNVLTLIKASGEKFEVIPYLETGWTRDQLEKLLSDAGLTPRAALRETKSPAKELGLLDEGVSDDVIFEAMLSRPVLVNRPIVVSLKGTKLCRPSETVLDLLQEPLTGPIHKEDGELIVDADGKIMV